MVEAVRIGMACAAENLVELLPARIDAKHALARVEKVTVEKVG